MDKTVSIVLKYLSVGAQAAQAQLKSVQDATKSFSSSITSTTRDASSATSSWASNFKSNFDEAARQAQIGSAIIIAAFAPITSEILSSVASFEKMSYAGKYLTGTTEGANKMAKAMRDMGVESMFSLEQVGGLFTRLVGNTKDVEKSEKIMRILMDTVAATGGSYGELEGVTRAWIQTNARGKASAQELNQFVNANVSVTRALGEAIARDLNNPLRQYIQVSGGAALSGKAFEKQVQGIMGQLQNIGDLDIPGTIAADAITQALEKAYGGASKVLLNSFSGQMETVKDRLRLAAMGFFGLTEQNTLLKGSIGDLLKNGLMQLNSFLSKNSENIEKWGKALAENKWIIMGLAGVIAGLLVGVLYSFIAGAVPFLAAFGAMGVVVGFIIERMGGFGNVVKVVGDTMTWLSGKFQPIIDALQPMIDRIGQLSTQFSGLGTAGERAMQILESKFSGFVGRLDQILQPIKNKLAFGDINYGGLEASWGNVLTGLYNRAKKFYDDTKKFLVFGNTTEAETPSFVKAMESAKMRFDTIVAEVQGKIAQFVNLTKPMWEPIIAAFQKVGIVYETSLKPALISLGQALQQLAPVLAWIGVSLATLVGIIVTVAAAIITGLVQGIAAVLPYITLIIAGVVNIFTGLINFFTFIFTGQWNLAWQAVVNIFMGVYQVLYGLVNGILAFISGFIMGIINFFATLAQVLLKDTIPNMVNGVVTWFQTMGSKGWKAITDMATNMVNAIKTLWTNIVTEVSSWPAKMGEWGKNLIQSFIDGMVSKIGALKEAANRVLSSIQGMFKSNSPPKEGPFMDIDKWGANIGMVWVDAFKDSIGTLATTPFTATTTALQQSSGTIPQSIASTGRQNTSSGDINITIQGDLTVDSDERMNILIQKITQALGRQNELATYGAGI